MADTPPESPGHAHEGEGGTDPRVLVFFDYACQFCYLDWPRMKRLRAEYGADIFLVPYELRPQLSTEGVPLTDFGGGHTERVEQHMRKMAAEGGLPLVLPSFVPNTHLALALGEYARDAGPETHEAVHEAVFMAYNGHGRNIGELGVLLEVARDHGLDRDDVADAISEGRYDERIHQFYHLGSAFGISATPAALVCNELFIGSRPYGVLSDSMQRCLDGTQGAEPSVEDAEEAAEFADARTEGAPPSIDR